MALTVGLNISGGRPSLNLQHSSGLGASFDLSGSRASQSSSRQNVSNSSLFSFDSQTSRGLNSSPRVDLSSSGSSGSASYVAQPSLYRNYSSNTSSDNVGAGRSVWDYLDTLAPYVGAVANYASASDANRRNENIANQNMQIVEANNQRNIAFQREQNEITRQREDNAYQRAAKDLELSGLSKTLAAGSPASASALSAPRTEAATNEYKYQDPLQRIDLTNMFLSVMKTFADIRNSTNLTNAQVNSLNSQASLNNISAGTLSEKNNADIDYTRSLTVASDAKAEYTRLESFFLSKYGDKEALAKIDNYVSNAVSNRASARLTLSRVDEVAQDIAESVARTEKLTFEKKKVLQDIAESKLKYEISAYNLGISRDMNMRTSDSLPNMFGIPVGYVAHGLSSLLTSLF